MLAGNILLQRIGLAVVLIPAAVAGSSQAQDTPPARSFSLAGRISVILTTDWAERGDEHPPPPNVLVASAPGILFTDILALENRKQHAVLKIAVSENPFFGGNGATLEAQMRAGNGETLAGHLFYFFFPPPRTCLARAKAAVDGARRAEEARVAGEKEERRAPRIVSASTNCEFASTPGDFYSEQVSPGVALDSAGSAQGMLPSFYVPPMEQVELAGKTFFLFEAQGQRRIGRAELDKFNLPEEMIGARPFFFWAIGAEIPFPFVRDPLRKNVQLIQIVYACLSATDAASPQFRELLSRIHFAP